LKRPRKRECLHDFRTGEGVRLFTLRGFDWTQALSMERFPTDGDAVVCREDGVSDFERLHACDATVVFYHMPRSYQMPS
jgi:hypothetical protein